ncbi:acyl carrier protein [Nocardia vermiculata]|uniref:Acyl carrier protein n=1 Tax=Nocardia vermiculata TaxID=257274 RepID=A0A846YAD6_9NOCA|nr:acyl carrier protein [Nocardia vermiculata]NKY53729.1 acyl carrier protein [Nocardia vermiculata]
MVQRKRIDTMVEAAVHAVAELLGSAPDTVSTTVPFSDLGLSSVQLARLTAVLEDALGVDISLTELYDHPDIEQLVDYLEVR